MSDRLERSSYVVDASVVLKWYVREQLSDQADVVAAALAGGEVILWAPSLVWVELASALCKKHRRGEVDPRRARQVWQEAVRLPITVVDTIDLLVDALDIALSVGCQAYDAVYVALARREDAPVLTADERLVRALSGTAFEGLAVSLRHVEAQP